MADIPQTMRALVAPKQCNPDGYEVRQVPTPKVEKPTDVLLRIHAVGLNTGDTQIPSGELSIFLKPEYPFTLGWEGSGVVVAVGSAVKSFKVGDEVYGFNLAKPLGSEPFPGWAAEYALGSERFLLHKPPSVSFEEAASYLGFVFTALQTISRGLQLGGFGSSLEGKTVFIPAALSGTGSIMIQVAKNVFGADKVISTVSTPKVGLVEQYLPGMVDQVIDYKKTPNVGAAIETEKVDIALDTQRTSLDDCIQVLKANNAEGGVLMSISSFPGKELAKEMMGPEKINFFVGLVLDLLQLFYKWKMRGTSIKFEFLSAGADVREELEKAGEVVALGKVKAVMRVVDFDDINGVKKACDELRLGKGGIGKLVLKLV